MAATRSRPAELASAGNVVAVKAKDAGATITSVARRAPVPAVAAGAAAAGLAGGLLLGSRHNVPSLAPRLFGRRRNTVQAVGDGLRHAAVVAGKASQAADDIRMLREQLDALNHRSPIEVVLDGLTHRRGAHRREG